MKKDIEWVISEIDQRVENVEEHEKTTDYNKGVARGFGISLFLIDQLDEPEKVIIPQFVADYIDKSREEGYSLYGAFDKMSTEVANWPIYSKSEGKSEGQDTFARAWLDGYEVEEEQKYRVLDGNTTLLGRINGLMLTTVEILEYYPEYTPTFDLTEQEIKDYDPRYMTFAKPVEEVAE